MSITVKFGPRADKPEPVINYGKITGEENGYYHSLPCISKSKLDDFIHLPLYYRRKYIDGVIRPKSSPEMSIGTIIGCAIGEGWEAFEKRYAITPEFGDLRLKENKQAKAEWEAANKDKEPCSAEIYEMIKWLEESVANHPVACQLLDAPGRENEVTWRTKVPGLPGLQAKTDIYSASGCALTKGRPFIADIKTVRELSSFDGFRAMRSNYSDFGYHRQHALYQALVQEITLDEIEDFFFIALETQQPYSVAVFRSSPAAIVQGWNEVADALTRLRKCYETNEWPGLPQDIVELDLSAFYYKQHALELIGGAP